MAGTASVGAAPFSCPPNFTATSPASEPTRFSLEVLRDPDTELWLIQAPVDFAPDCLNGRLVPLSGSRIVKGKLAGKRHRYRVLRSSGPQAGEATLLAPSGEAGGGLTCAPAPQGSLRIFDGPQESPSGTLLQPIPATPPPQIPPGLRPRFCAFGGSLPVTGPGSVLALKSLASRKRKKKRQIPEASAPQEEVNGLGGLEVDTALGSPDGDVGKKKKKQELKELEVMEPVAAEPTAETSEPPGAPFPSTTPKKKKKKPHGAQTVEPEEQTPAPEEKTVELELEIRREPPEETVLSPTRKRRRQKGMEGREPEEGSPAEALLPPKVEPREETIPLPSPKKKKEKGCKVTLERGSEAAEPPAPPGKMTELPHQVEPRAEATPSTRKRRKKEKGPDATGEAGEAGEPQVEPEPPGDIEPPAALAATKKQKKERSHKATEPRAETSTPQAEVPELEPPDEGEPEARAAPASTKKRKKRGGGSGVPETAAQEEMPEPPPPPCLESGEVASAGWGRKRKKLQQDPV